MSNPLLGVGVLAFDTGEFRLLVPGAGGGRYAAGHLLFARPGMLLAAPFDLERLAITGPETVVLEGLRTEAEGVSPQPQAVLSREGRSSMRRGEDLETRRDLSGWIDDTSSNRCQCLLARTGA